MFPKCDTEFGVPPRHRQNEETSLLGKGRNQSNSGRKFVSHEKKSQKLYTLYLERVGIKLYTPAPSYLVKFAGNSWG